MLLLECWGSSMARVFIVALVLVGVFLAIVRFLTIPVSAGEPPALYSRIPGIGHLINLIRQGPYHIPSLGYLGLPAASLVNLGGHVYAVWDQHMIQTLQRNKNLSFTPFIREFTRMATGYHPRHQPSFNAQPGVMDAMRRVFHDCMAPKFGDPMNVMALRCLVRDLENVKAGEVREIENGWLWFRNLMTRATGEALFGLSNPWVDEPGSTLMEDIWEYERGVDNLVMMPWPQLTCRRVLRARDRVQNAQRAYFLDKQHLNDDVSEVIKQRVQMLESYGFTLEEIGDFEVSILHVSLTNSVAAGFWFMAYVYDTEGLVEELRAEVEPILERKKNEDGDEVVSVDIHHVFDRCPLLLSSYREALRLTNQFIGNRFVESDTVASDGKGTTFILKRGFPVQWPARYMHVSPSIWGPDCLTFNPRRFLDISKSPSSKDSRDKMSAYIPFGGGKHYCPGRHFAQAENAGVMVALLVAYDVSSRRAEDREKGVIPMPGFAAPSFASAEFEPVNEGKGYGIQIARRDGWENVKWNFTSDGKVGA